MGHSLCLLLLSWGFSEDWVTLHSKACRVRIEAEFVWHDKYILYICWWWAELQNWIVPCSHLSLFILVVQCFLPETVVPHISTGQISFSPFCASHAISPQQELCLIWALPSTWGVTLGRNPNLLIWGPRQGLTEAKKATTRPQTLLYPVSERSITDLWVCEHFAAWSRWTEKVLLKYPLKKEDSPRLLVQVSLYCSWPISFRYLLCWWRKCHVQNGVALNTSYTGTSLWQISNL